jgi:hypothetical protein
VCAVSVCLLHLTVSTPNKRDMLTLLNFCFFQLREYCPVSNAYLLFTSLGLRHLVVLGGITGGEVVGVLTRENLLPEYIEARTGI